MVGSSNWTGNKILNLITRVRSPHPSPHQAIRTNGVRAIYWNKHHCNSLCFCEGGRAGRLRRFRKPMAYKSVRGFDSHPSRQSIIVERCLQDYIPIIMERVGVRFLGPRQRGWCNGSTFSCCLVPISLAILCRVNSTGRVSALQAESCGFKSLTRHQKRNLLPSLFCFLKIKQGKGKTYARHNNTWVKGS